MRSWSFGLCSACSLGLKISVSHKYRMALLLVNAFQVSGPVGFQVIYGVEFTPVFQAIKCTKSSSEYNYM
jgi:hypothetical protein